MSEPDPDRRQATIPPPDEDEAEGGWLAEYGGLIGVLFVLMLIGGAIYMIERMRHYADLGDCAFTHAPQCAELLKR